jgi:hypothetical protein
MEPTTYVLFKALGFGLLFFGFQLLSPAVPDLC